ECWYCNGGAYTTDRSPQDKRLQNNNRNWDADNRHRLSPPASKASTAHPNRALPGHPRGGWSAIYAGTSHAKTNNMRELVANCCRGTQNLFPSRFECTRIEPTEGARDHRSKEWPH